jgi:hypothetical protein
MIDRAIVEGAMALLLNNRKDESEMERLKTDDPFLYSQLETARYTLQSAADQVK